MTQKIAKFFGNILPLAATIFFLVGCGGTPLESSLRHDTTSAPVLVLMGGNQSCREHNSRQTPEGMDMLREFAGVVAGAESVYGTTARTIVSCYGETATVYYYFGDDPSSVQQADREGFRDAIASHLDDDSPLFFIGHSYGGWLSMKTALDFSEYRQIAGLFTIDPISRETCSFERPWGCNEAPSDFSGAQKSQIRDQSQIWSNFYQSKTWYLHSSKINEAHNNHKIAASHTSIDTEAEVWTVINEFVTQSQHTQPLVTSL